MLASRASECRQKPGETHLERAEQALVDAHHGASIVEFTTIVGCREQRDKLSLREELVTVLDNLMCTADQVHVMLLQETGNNVRAESKRHTTIILAPAGYVLVGIGPQEIAEETAVGDLGASAR